MKNPRLRVLLDLDCVLADFVSAALRVHGLTFADVKPQWKPGKYGLTTPIGRALGRTDFTEEDFWGPITGVPRGKFWEDLQPLLWAKELAETVFDATDDWWIVTAPSHCEYCIEAKRKWLEGFMSTFHPAFRRDGKGGAYFWRLVPTPAKYLLANPRTVLIDDCDENCEKFLDAGGHAITFPNYHNHLHRLSDDPLPFVSVALESFSRRVK